MSIRQSFMEQGFYEVKAALTDSGRDFLVRLAIDEEKNATAPMSGWRSHTMRDVLQMKEPRHFSDHFKTTLEAICDANAFARLQGGFAFPQLTYSEQGPPKQRAFNWHVDGADPGSTRVGQYRVLVAILLSLVRNQDDGAFVFWKTSHHEVSKQLLIAHPQMVLRDAINEVVFSPVVAGLTPFVGSVGDAVICHHLLVHGTADRKCDGVRRMAFFRLNHNELEEGVTVAGSTFANVFQT